MGNWLNWQKVSVSWFGMLMSMKMSEADVVLNPGEMYIVPKGIERNFLLL